MLRIETVLIVIEYLKKKNQHFLYRMICIKDNGGWMVTNMSDLSCSSSIILVLYSVKLSKLIIARVSVIVKLLF